jgi:hypothetical protein
MNWPLIVGMVLAIPASVFWDATRSPVICMGSGWETQGKHWVNESGKQCSYMRSNDWMSYLHPEERW